MIWIKLASSYSRASNLDQIKLQQRKFQLRQSPAAKLGSRYSQDHDKVVLKSFHDQFPSNMVLSYLLCAMYGLFISRDLNPEMRQLEKLKGATKNSKTSIKKTRIQKSSAVTGFKTDCLIN